MSPRWQHRGGASMPLSAAPSVSAEGATGRGVAGVSCGRRQVRRWSGRFAEHTVRAGNAVLVTVGPRTHGVFAGAWRWRHRLVSAGHDRCSAALARSRGSSQGFAHAADCEPRVLAAVVQLHGGDIVARVSRQQMRASRVAWSRRRARASVRGGHHRVGACSNAAGPSPAGKRGSDTAMKRGSGELVESAATSIRAVRRIG